MKMAGDDARYVSICISDDYVINGAVSEDALKYINLLQENELLILDRALIKLDCYDLINNWIAEGDQRVVVDAASFLRNASLDYVFIAPNGDSEFQYISGGPLLRFNVSEDLVPSDAYFDGLI
jgi:hypothetical protein